MAVEEGLETGLRAWKASELLDDYVFVKGGAGYGWLDDLIFSDSGRLQAVIVDPDVTYAENGFFAGPYPFPWYGYPHFDPGLSFFELPYAPGDIAGLEPFD